MMVLVLAGVAHARESAKPKVSTLAACPASGAEERGTPRGLLNEVKRRVPTSTSPVLLDFTDIASLQEQADARVRAGRDAAFTAAERAKLRDLTVRDRRVSEGDLVGMVGYLVGKPKPNAGESVNCYLPGPANNDIHIAYGATPQAPLQDALVAEMIPQSRPKGWTVSRLKGLSKEGRQVLVIGQLMFDSFHQLGDEPRMSLWEIHPVTRLLICQRASHDCDPAHEEQWKPLQ